MGTMEKVVHEPVGVDVGVLDGLDTDDKLADALIDAAESLGSALVEIDKPEVVRSSRALMTLMTAVLVRAGINPVLAQRENHVAETQTTAANR
jgi:hypothetical protein